MSTTVLVLEDNNDKIVQLLNKYPDIFVGRTILIMRNEVEAELFMSTVTGQVILVIDYELDPGCGDGLSFLKFCLSRYSLYIEEVILTTFSDWALAEMINCCLVYNVNYEKVI